MGAASGLHKPGVAGAQADSVHGQLQLVRRHLHERGLMALSRGMRAGDNFDAGPGHVQLDALARRPDWRFDIVGDADAAWTPGVLLAGSEALVVGAFERALHVAWEIDCVQDKLCRRAIWQISLRHQIAPAYLRAIDAELACREVEQALDRVMGFRPAGAAVGHRWNRVRAHGL